MVHTNCERNNVPAMLEVAVARREACNGERNNVPSLKKEKWNGDATVLWVVGNREITHPEFTPTDRPNGRVELVDRMPIQLAQLFMRRRKYHCLIYY